MQYSTEIKIDLPRERVIELFDSWENIFKWQEGLKSCDLISGEEGKAGAKTKLVYDMKGRRTEMVETIVKREFPDEFTATYDAKGVHNLVENHFYEEGPDKTRWTMENDFNFSGLMKLMGFFMGGQFPKETLKGMNNFNEFAEKVE